MTHRLFKPENTKLTKGYQKGPHKLRMKYGPFTGLLLEEKFASKQATNHSLCIYGQTDAFEALWCNEDWNWVTCQSTAFDGITKEVVIGLHAEHDNESLIVLSNPFSRVAQSAMHEWEEKQAAEIVLVFRASGNLRVVPVQNPSACPDRIQLPIILTHADSLSHERCVESILDQVPDCVKGRPTAYAMAVAWECPS